MAAHAVVQLKEVMIDGSEADSDGREIFDKLYVENVQKDYKLNPLPPHLIKTHLIHLKLQA